MYNIGQCIITYYYNLFYILIKSRELGVELFDIFQHLPTSNMTSLPKQILQPQTQHRSQNSLSPWPIVPLLHTLPLIYLQLDRAPS